MKIAIQLLAALSVTFSLAQSAQAQLAQAYVSDKGSDGNTCTDANPCRTLWRALNVVPAGGQIWIVDSGNFGTSVTLNITKSVSIRAVPGVLASVSAALNTPAIQVNVPGGTVALRNLTITDQGGLNPGTDGLVITDAGTVSVEDCLFADTRRNAVYIPGSSATVHISNTTFRNVTGLAVSAANGATVDISSSRLMHTGGVLSYANSQLSAVTTSVSVTDTTISDGSFGVSAQGWGAAATAQAFMTRSTIFGTAYALDSEAISSGTSLVTVSNSSITHNQNAFNVLGAAATLKSLGNNYIADNAGEQGALTPIPLR
jgi:hypothetical protein